MNCPKCNQPMACGAPHTSAPVQYECRRCNVYIPVSK